jgi:hypothetical protein
MAARERPGETHPRLPRVDAPAPTTLAPTGQGETELLERVDPSQLSHCHEDSDQARHMA